MYKNQLFSITNKNSVKLKEFAKSKNMTMSKIINILIDSYCNNDEKLDQKLENYINKISISDNSNSSETNPKNIQIKVSQNEYNVLKELAEKECLNSVARFVKYLISLKIYKENTPSNSEIIELNKAKNELKALGRNLNQLVKNINRNNQDINVEKLNSLLNQIDQKQDNLNYKINRFVNINRKKY